MPWGKGLKSLKYLLDWRAGLTKDCHVLPSLPQTRNHLKIATFL
jgi:hypothetical protein